MPPNSNYDAIQPIDITSLYGYIRIPLVSLIFLISGLMLTMPGPIDALPNIQISGAFVGATNIYIFLLFIFSLFTLFIRAQNNLTSAIRVPESAKFILLFCVLTVVSSIGKSNFGLNAIIELIQWASFVGLMLIGSNYISSMNDVRKVLYSVILISLAKSIYILCSLVLFGMPGSSFGSEIMGMGLLVIMSPVFSRTILRKRLLASLVLIVPILLSNNRKVIVAILFAVITINVGWKIATTRGSDASGIWPASVFLSGIVLSLIVVTPGLQNTVFSHIRPLLITLSKPRFHLYQTGFNMFSENLLFGVGIDNWHISKPTYATDGLIQLEAMESKDWGAHSYFLKVLSELGLIGYTLFFLAVVVPIKQAHYYISKCEINNGVWVAIASLSVYFIFIGSVSAISKPLQASWFLLIGISSAAAAVAKSR